MKALISVLLILAILSAAVTIVKLIIATIGLVVVIFCLAMILATIVS